MKKTFVTRLLAVVICIAMLATVTPIFAAAETTITEITITDADVTPYIGEKAGDWLDYTLPENCHFTMARHYWYNETTGSSMKADEVFAAGSRYDLYWRCEPESGYTFSAGATVTINGQTDILDSTWTKIDDEDDTIFYVWTKVAEAVEKPAANVIDKIEITNADVTPYIGEKAGDWLDYTLPENRHYTVDRHYWYDETDGKSLIATDTFEADISYQVGWWLIADEGYVFAEDATVTINGQTDIDWEYTYRGDIFYTDGENEFFVWTKADKAVEKPAATVIDKIEISDVDSLPVIGEKANDHIDYTFSENCHFTAAKHGWYDKTAYEWVDGADDTFVAGHIYQVGWWLDADEGYTFAEDPTVTINGGENINWGDTYIDEVNSMRFFVWSEPREAVEKPADIEITEIHITDADVTPYIGEKAGDWLDYTLPEDCHFTVIDHYWYDESAYQGLDDDATFAADGVYDRFWRLKADTGYTFDENATVTINGQTDILDPKYTEIDDEDDTTFYVWTKSTEAVEKPAANVIDKIEINGFCDPVVGGKAGDFIHLTLPEDAPYYFGYSCWYNDTDDHNLSSGDTFEAGKFYSLGGGLIADAGYVFAEDPEVLLNGGDVGVDEKFTKRDAINAGIFHIWDELKEAVEPIVIDKIAINDVDLEPVAGEKAGDHLGLTLPENCHYTVSKVRWYSLPIESDEEFSGMNNEDVFETETIYYAEYILLPDEGYVFAKDAAVTINGSTERMGSAFLSGDGSFSILTKQTECVAPIEKLLGDANNDGAVNMKDVLALRKQLAGMAPVINMTNADCNGDGTVNMKDVLQLRKYLAGLITELGA